MAGRQDRWERQRLKKEKTIERRTVGAQVKAEARREEVSMLIRSLSRAVGFATNLGRLAASDQLVGRWPRKRQVRQKKNKARPKAKTAKATSANSKSSSAELEHATSAIREACRRTISPTCMARRARTSW